MRYFFQAEDGIRDRTVTGVQTCALPIWVPVYATPLTRAFVAEKLREHVLPEPADLRLMRPREPFALGPFTIEPIRVTHSIAEIGRASCRARVETAGGATPREKKKAEPAR